MSKFKNLLLLSSFLISGSTTSQIEALKPKTNHSYNSFVLLEEENKNQINSNRKKVSA